MVARTPSQEDYRAVAADWLRRGFSCGLWADPPGATWVDFVHGTDELLMVLAGEVELEVAGRRFFPAIGEEVLIPAGVRHSVWNRGTTTSYWLYGYGE